MAPPLYQIREILCTYFRRSLNQVRQLFRCTELRRMSGLNLHHLTAGGSREHLLVLQGKSMVILGHDICRGNVLISRAGDGRCLHCVALADGLGGPVAGLLWRQVMVDGAGRLLQGEPMLAEKIANVIQTSSITPAGARGGGGGILGIGLAASLLDRMRSRIMNLPDAK